MRIGKPHSARPEAAQQAYERGDIKSAIRQWTALAKQGDGAAAFALGELYRNGAGVKSDLPKALRWYKTAADLGSEKASMALGLRPVTTPEGGEESSPGPGSLEPAPDIVHQTMAEQTSNHRKPGIALFARRKDRDATAPPEAKTRFEGRLNLTNEELHPKIHQTNVVEDGTPPGRERNAGTSQREKTCPDSGTAMPSPAVEPGPQTNPTPVQTGRSDIWRPASPSRARSAGDDQSATPLETISGEGERKESKPGSGRRTKTRPGSKPLRRHDRSLVGQDRKAKRRNRAATTVSREQKQAGGGRRFVRRLAQIGSICLVFAATVYLVWPQSPDSRDNGTSGDHEGQSLSKSQPLSNSPSTEPETKAPNSLDESAGSATERTVSLNELLTVSPTSESPIVADPPGEATQGAATQREDSPTPKPEGPEAPAELGPTTEITRAFPGTTLTLEPPIEDTGTENSAPELGERGPEVALAFGETELISSLTLEEVEPAGELIATNRPQPKIYGLENESARVVLRATDEVLVQVLDRDGQVLINRIFQPGDQYHFPVEDGIILVTDAPSRLVAEVDGEPIVLRSHSSWAEISMDPDTLKEEANLGGRLTSDTTNNTF